MSEKLEVRCFCHRKTLLALCGWDKKDKTAFIHVKTVKNLKTITEVVVTSGIARIRCRECLRWHTIRIVKENVSVLEEQLPETICV